MEIITTIQDLNDHFDYYMIGGERRPYDENGNGEKHNYGKAKGFSIGRGKIKFWYITVSPMGFFYAYPSEQGKHWERQIETNTKVVIHYEKP